jgi:hypothetical protein
MNPDRIWGHARSVADTGHGLELMQPHLAWRNLTIVALAPLPSVSWTGVRAGARCRPTRPRSGIGRTGNEAKWPST